MSAPTIQSEIQGGLVQITLGGSLDPTAALAEADSLAVALQPRHRLQARYRVRDIRILDEFGLPAE